MKKLILTLLLGLGLTFSACKKEEPVQNESSLSTEQRRQAGFSDFTTDSVAFADGMQLGFITIDSNTFNGEACANEFGFEIGVNEVIMFPIRTINMGPHDAIVNESLDPSGVFFDSCHWHNHIDGWNVVYLMTGVNGDTLSTGGKVGFNLVDGGNIMQWLSSGGNSALDNWLNSYGTPDYSLINHPPNPDFDGDENMGVSAGHYDTYWISTWGNQIRINDIPNGHYVVKCVGNFSRYFNQGANVFPDYFYVPVIISGVYPNRTLQVTNVFPNPCPLNAPPGNISGLNYNNPSSTLTWNPGLQASSYKVYRSTPNSLPVFLQEVTGTSYTPSWIGLSNGFYYFHIQSKNCFGESQLITSRKIKHN